MPDTPELTFTEDEVKDLTGFLNLVTEHCKLECGAKAALEFSKYYGRAAAIRNKMESHVFEIRRKITPKPKDDK